MSSTPPTKRYASVTPNAPTHQTSACGSSASRFNASAMISNCRKTIIVSASQRLSHIYVAVDCGNICTLSILSAELQSIEVQRKVYRVFIFHYSVFFSLMSTNLRFFMSCGTAQYTDAATGMQPRCNRINAAKESVLKTFSRMRRGK